MKLDFFDATLVFLCLFIFIILFAAPSLAPKTTEVTERADVVLPKEQTVTIQCSKPDERLSIQNEGKKSIIWCVKEGRPE